MTEEPLALLPEMFLAAGAVGGLLLGLVLPRHSQWIVAAVAAAACAAGIVAAIVAAFAAPRLVYGDSFAVDVGLHTGRILVLIATLLVLALSAGAVHGQQRETEFYVLTLLGALGAIVLAGASDLLLLFAAYLLASVPLYALAGFAKDATGTEASLKYYLLGAYLGMLMLVGVTVLYGVGRSTTYSVLAGSLGDAPQGVVAVGLIALAAGLLFKIGAVPSHFWVPDVTEGATVPAAAFVTTIPKIGGLIALYRLVDVALPAVSVDWRLLVALLATASMTLGNLAAFFQDTPRRLLGYSTVSQVGYMLVAVVVAGSSDVALEALLYYLVAYAVTNIGAFAVIASLQETRTLADYRGLSRTRPWLAGSLAVCLLGFVGTPPTSIFVGKLEIFTAAIDGGYAWLAAVAVANSVASLFYYLRWIAPTFSRGSASSPTPDSRNVLAPATAYVAAALSLALGIGAGAVLHMLRSSGLS